MSHPAWNSYTCRRIERVPTAYVLSLRNEVLIIISPPKIRKYRRRMMRQETSAGRAALFSVSKDTVTGRRRKRCSHSMSAVCRTCTAIELCIKNQMTFGDVSWTHLVANDQAECTLGVIHDIIMRICLYRMPTSKCQ